MRLCSSALLFAVIICTSLVAAEVNLEDAALAELGKKSTVLVELAGGEGYGSAFCIDAQGYFLTDNHVVAHATNNVKVIVAPGQANQKVVTAKVVRADEHLDLALLKVEDANLITAVSFGDDQELSELQEVIAFGFPFGKELSLSASEYPSISVNKGRVTALRKKDGKLNRIQLDAVLNPGNSGGPILDKHGRVIGLVVSGVRGAGAVNFAIPASHAREFLHKPEITVKAPPLDDKALSSDAQLTVHLTSFFKADYAVELAVKNAQGSRQFKGEKQDNGDFVFKFVPLPEEPQKQVELSAAFANGELAGPVVDRELTLGDKTFKLSDVQQITPGTPGETVLASGDKLAGLPGGLHAMLFTVNGVGGALIRADLTKATSIVVKRPDARARQVSYTVTVKYDGAAEEVTGELTSGSAAPSSVSAVANAAGSEIKSLPLPNGNSEVKLPGPLNNVVVGGAGRYLIGYIEKLNKLAIFDANQGEITKYISVPDHILFAAGRTKLIVVVTGSNIVQRYSLETFEREISTQLPTMGTIENIVMGYASEGPLLVQVTENRGPLSNLMLLDINKLTAKRVAIKSATNMGSIVMFKTIHMRASPDGTVFGMWNSEVSPSGVQSLVLNGINGEATCYYEHESHGHVIPGDDGNHIYTNGCVYTTELKKLEGSYQQGMAYMPALESPYFFAISCSLYNTPSSQAGKKDLYLFGPSDSKPVVSVPNIVNYVHGDQWGTSDFTLDKHYYVMMKSKLIVTIPGQNDRFVLTHFDITELLKAADVDYLFVSSSPPRVAEKNKKYEYKIVVESRKGGVKIALDSGPKGMTLSQDNELTWTPPDDADAENGVILRVSDKSGQETFHTFSVKVK